MQIISGRKKQMPGRVKLLLIDSDGEVPEKHRRLIPFLKTGWKIESVEPRIVEPATAKLLVKLTSPLGRRFPAIRPGSWLTGKARGH